MERQAIAWEHPTGKSHPRIFLNEQARPDRRPFNFSKYHTFISHKGNDTNLAELVGSILYQAGLSAYLDKWDPKVDGDSPELEEHIREIIRQTPSILAVVTKNTSMSWWVPFEIGVARETDSRIATYLFIVDQPNSATVELPSYLRTWPILASAEELKAWARALAGARPTRTPGRTTLSEEDIQRSESSFNLGEIDRLVHSGNVRFV